MRFSVRSGEAALVRERGFAIRNGPLTIRHIPGEWYRFSPVIAKRFGNAPERNRVKRIIREIMQKGLGAFPAGSYLVSWHAPCKETGREEIETHLLDAVVALRDGAVHEKR